MMKFLIRNFILINILFLSCFFYGLNYAKAEGQTIKSATEYDYPPFSVTSGGQADGFSVELLKATLKEVNLGVDFYIAPWAKIKEDLKQGDIDVLPLVGRTPEREEFFDFTVPYMTIYGGVFVRDDSDIKAYTDLKAKEIIVMKGDNAEEFAMRENISDKIISVESYEEAFRQLSEGKHDAIIVQSIVGNQIVKQFGFSNVKMAFQLDNFRQDFTFAVKKNNKELLNLLNDGLSRVIADGKFDIIHDKWFSEDENNFTESLNYESESEKIAKKIAIFFDNCVDDTLLVSKFNFSEEEKVKKEIEKFYADNKQDIWFNIGSDESPIEQKKSLPLYKEISFIDASGQEKIKYREGEFIEDLKNVSIPENTEFKSETYFKDAKKINKGEVYIGKVATNYTFFDDVFKNLPKEDENKFEKVIARDIMKQGVIRFSSPVYDDNKFIGVVVLSLDYRHFQELVKHIEPGNSKEVISASYSRNYILVFDIDGNTVIHPKPNNIRGYLPDGSLAGFNEENSVKDGKIFNLFAYDKSQAYPDMAKKVINEKEVYTSSATDVSGRTKLTVAVPIIYNNSKTNYKDIGILGGLMMSVSLADKKSETFEELSIKLKALQVAKQVDDYLEKNPELTLRELQKDKIFQSLAVQQVGETGYTALIDSQTGYFYFHPQEKLINTDSHLLKEKLPDFWKIFDNTIGDKCQDARGYYNWTEADGSITKKYLYTACVKNATADGKNLFIGATSYVNELEAKKYLEKYEIKKDFADAKEAIKQKAIDVAKQIEIYINAHPEKTLFDLQQDEYFQKIAVQPVGKTGYTAVNDYNTLITRFHVNPDIVDLDLSTLAKKLPEFWDLVYRTKGGREVGGVYNWEESDGSFKQKYLYFATVHTKTADGVGLSVAATTYLDEYKKPDEGDSYNTPDSSHIKSISQIENINFVFYIYWFLGGLAFVIFVFWLLYYFKVIKLERTSLFIIIIIIFLLVSGFFIFGSYRTVQKLKIYFKDSYIKQHLQLENILSKEVTELIENMNLELDFLSKATLNENSDKDTYAKLLKGAYVRNNKYAYAVYRINKDNIIKDMYPVNDASIGADLSDQAHMQKIKKTLKPVLSDVFNAVEGFQAVTLHYPVIKDGKYDGTVAFLINIDNFFGIISPFSNHLYKQESFLLDTHGQIIVSDNKDYVGKNILKLEKYKTVKNNYEKILMSDNAGFDDFVLKKEKQISTFTPIKIQDNKWMMVINGEEKDAYSGIDSTLNSIWFFTLIALISLVVFGLFFSYFLTKSLRKEVENKTAEIKNNSYLIEEQLRKEELITQEKDELLNEQKRVKKELEEEMEEMEKFQNLTVNRELKMIELKEKIRNLEKINLDTN